MQLHPAICSGQKLGKPRSSRFSTIRILAPSADRGFRPALKTCGSSQKSLWLHMRPTRLSAQGLLSWIVCRKIRRIP